MAGRALASRWPNDVCQPGDTSPVNNASGVRAVADRATGRPGASRVITELWQESLAKLGASWGEVTSNSMAPAIKEGDRVLVERVHWEEARFGDIVVFRRADMLVVHRVLGRRFRAGRSYLVEKGDAVLWLGLVPGEDVLGRVRSIQNSRGTGNALSGAGRALQLTLAFQSYACLQVWGTIEWLRRLAHLPYSPRFAAAYRRLSSLGPRVTLKLALRD